jgi:hypothetical protein
MYEFLMMSIVNFEDCTKYPDTEGILWVFLRPKKNLSGSGNIGPKN